MDLGELGWDSEREGQFLPWLARGLSPARVVSENKLAYTVVDAGGDRPAVITGRLRHLRPDDVDLPKVGDWVALSMPPGEAKGLIHGILPRRTRIVRKVTGRENRAQVVAANVDTVFVVQALDATFNVRRIERFLVMVLEGGARPVVVLNKLDLCDAPAARIAEAEAVARGVPVLAVCARTGRGTGLLRGHCGPGRSVAFVGTSGVGKSSLINRLLGERAQATLPVRDSDSKGRHATSWREILPVPGGGVVIDTPGMREFHMWSAEGGLAEAFPDIAALSAGCRYRDCSHGAEPGCAVRDAVAAGRVPAERHGSFLRLRRELDAVEHERREAARRPAARAGRPGRAPSPAEEDDDGE